MRKHLAILTLALAATFAAGTAGASPVIVCDHLGCRSATPHAEAGKASHERGALRTAARSRLLREASRQASPGEVVAHPAGCPWRRFCGCGVAAKVFGPGVRFVRYAGKRLNLWQAAEWLRFPRSVPGPGKVAARAHHVMLIREVHSDGTATVFDPNSGGHLTRVHRVSLRGFTVVDPTPARLRLSMD